MFSWFLLMRINSKKKTCDLWQWRENARPVATAGKRAPCLDSVWFLIGWKRVTMTLIASNTLPFSNTLKKKKIPHKEHYLPRDTYTTCIKILTRKTYITLHYVTSRYLHHSYNTIFTLLVLFYHFTIFTLFTLLYLHQLHYDTFFAHPLTWL